MTRGVVASFASSDRDLLQYQVDVVARSVADVVRCVGGWIFDRTMQGWAANVVVPHTGDCPPLEILGATVNKPRPPEHSAPQVFLDANAAAGTKFVEHRLSTAARVFKAQALIAAQLKPTTGLHESFFVIEQSEISGHSGRTSSDGVAVKVSDLQPVTAVPSS